MGAFAASVPLLYLVVRGTEGGLQPLVDALWRERTLRLLASSIGLTLAVTSTCLVLGTATAWLLTRAALPGRAAWLVLSALPLAVPSYVAAYGWLASAPGINGFVPAWLVLSAVSTPYVTLPTAAAFRVSDPALAEVARSLGRSPTRAWCTATLPQVAPAAIAGGLLVALYTLSDFGAVSMLRFEVFTFAIARQYGSFLGRDVAVALALVLVALAIAVVLIERRVRGVSRRWRVGSGSRRVTSPVPLGRWAALAYALLFIAPTCAVGVPVWALFDRLLTGTNQPLDLAELLGAVGTTAVVATAGAVLATALALPIGVLAARHRGRITSSLETLGYAGHALPGIVVALSLVFISLRVVPGLYQSVVVLVFGYAVMFMPKAIGATRTSVAMVPPALTDVARSLGRGPMSAHRATTWRLAAPGITAGWLLVTLTAMKELPATLLLRPTGLDTLATEIWGRTASAAYGAAAPYALALIIVAGIPAFWLSRPSSWELSR